jgi:hypothetical protein
VRAARFGRAFFYHRPECVQVLVNFADPNLLWEPPVPKSARTSDMSARQGALMLGSMSSIWLDAGLVTTGVSTRAHHEHPKMSLVGMASQRGFVAVMEVRMRRRDGMWHVDVIRCMSMLSVACRCCLLHVDVACCTLHAVDARARRKSMEVLAATSANGRAGVDRSESRCVGTGRRRHGSTALRDHRP